MKTLIIGSGLVGKRLLALMPESISTTTSPDKARQNERLILLDAFDAEALRNTISTVAPSVVVYAMAPKKYPEGEEYRHFFVNSTSNVVESLSGREHLIFLGSTAPYGDHGGRLVNEEAKLLTNTNRGLAQRDAQTLVLSYKDSTIIRLGGLYAEEAGMAKARLYSEPRAGNPERMLNFVHADDVARAVLHLSRKPHLGVYNLAGLSISARDLMPLVPEWMQEAPADKEWTESNFVLSSDKISCKPDSSSSTMNSVHWHNLDWSGRESNRTSRDVIPIMVSGLVLLAYTLKRY